MTRNLMLTLENRLENPLSKKIFQLGGIPASPGAKLRVGKPSLKLKLKSNVSTLRFKKSGNTSSQKITITPITDFQKKRKFFEGFLNKQNGDFPQCGRAQQYSNFNPLHNPRDSTGLGQSEQISGGPARPDQPMRSDNDQNRPRETR